MLAVFVVLIALEVSVVLAVAVGPVEVLVELVL